MSTSEPDRSIERKETPQQRWGAKHPLEKWAHQCLRSAVRRGLLLPQPCAICGAPNTDGHHEDYNRPMAVTWLCRKHHKQRHVELRRGAA
jgi:hypothetical protein